MRRALAVACAAIVMAGLGSGASGSPRPSPSVALTGRAFWREHGYLVPDPARYAEAKERAAAFAAAARPHQPAGRAPVAGPSVPGISDPNVTPPDPNGAIGPRVYVEIVNLQLGIFDRSGMLLASAPIESIVGGNHFHYSDPQILWDPATNRFFFEIWDTTSATFRWGFSKDSSPRTADPSSWCTYISGFGYSGLDGPDYPKLGQTKDFLLIGVNFFKDFSTWGGGDVLWIDNPQGRGALSTCPSNTFRTGRFTGVHNPDGSLLFTPVPAQQTDLSGRGWVLAQSDTADASGGFNYLSVMSVTKDPATAEPDLSRVRTLPVAEFDPPAPAEQCGGTGNDLDTLDGRLEHAVSAVDPRLGSQVVWTAMAVLGGAGSEERWFEIVPETDTGPRVLQAGVVTDPSNDVFNGAVSPDRTVSRAGRSHGTAMVMGFTTSSSTRCADAEMVSKVGNGVQSDPVVVDAPGVPLDDFSCTFALCRWGDYAGASPDPAAPLAGKTGAVWLAEDVPDASGAVQGTWVWRASP
jgi:hypothetical protein